MQDILGSKIRGKENQIKCVILMSNVLDFSRSSLFIQSLGRVTKKKLAIGGCIGHLAHDSDSRYVNRCIENSLYLSNSSKIAKKSVKTQMLQILYCLNSILALSIASVKCLKLLKIIMTIILTNMPERLV